MSFFGGGASTSTTTPAAEKDIEVADPPPDSISSLAFSPQADYLAVGSWDNNVRFVYLALLLWYFCYCRKDLEFVECVSSWFALCTDACWLVFCVFFVGAGI